MCPENGTITADEPARFAKVIIKTEFEYESLMKMLNTLQRRYLLNLLNKFRYTTEPIYDFISGGAGVGKSKLIDAIYQTLMREFTKPAGSKVDAIRVLVTGLTGRAAFMSEVQLYILLSRLQMSRLDRTLIISIILT